MVGKLRTALMTGLLTASLQSPVSHAGWFASFSDGFDENMLDEQDGKLDISNYLSSTTGFLPAPIIVTEPAVGFAAGTDNGTKLDSFVEYDGRDTTFTPRKGFKGLLEFRNYDDR